MVLIFDLPGLKTLLKLGYLLDRSSGFTDVILEDELRVKYRLLPPLPVIPRDPGLQTFC